MIGRLTWALLALCSVMLVSPASPVGAQQPQRAGQREMPRTEWGHPDLQGNWTNATLTPFERGQGLGPVYTLAQVDSIEGTQQAVIETGHDPSDPDRAPPTAGNVGGYNQVYFDRGDRVARVGGEPRSSLITFPANGRIPALTAGGEQRLQEYRDFVAQFGESDHPELRTLSDQCLTSFGSNMGPPMLPNGFYNNNYTIVQNEDHVLILAEMV